MTIDLILNISLILFSLGTIVLLTIVLCCCIKDKQFSKTIYYNETKIDIKEEDWKKIGDDFQKVGDDLNKAFNTFSEIIEKEKNNKV